MPTSNDHQHTMVHGGTDCEHRDGHVEQVRCLAVSWNMSDVHHQFACLTPLHQAGHQAGHNKP